MKRKLLPLIVTSMLTSVSWGQQLSIVSIGDEADAILPTLAEVKVQKITPKSLGIPEIMDIVVWSAPNPSSSSYPPAVANALAGIEAGTRTSVGSGNSEFRPIADGELLQTWEFTLTSFPYFRGVTQPAGSSENGNRLQVGTHKVSRTPFSLAQFMADQASSDGIGGTNTLRFSASFANINYSPSRKGINYGPDGIKGTADDLVYTSGPGTALIHELIYSGFATAYVAANLDEVDGANGIKAYVAQNRPFSVTDGYTFNGVRFQRSLSVFPPSPPPPSPTFNITPRISLTPSGNIGPGTPLQVSTDVINTGPTAYFGTITNSIQVRRSFATTGIIISDWSRWEPPGTSFTQNLGVNEVKSALSYPWNADGADGIKYELRAVESDSSGTQASSVVSVTVVPIPNQPGPPLFKLAVSVSPTGTVLTGGALQLTATVSNVGGTAYFGTFTFRAESSIDGGKTWTAWPQAGVGVVTGLGVGETKTAFSFPWNADGVDNKVYQFRIVGATSENQRLESGSTPTVTVVPGIATGPLVLSIRRGNSVDVSATVPPGNYLFEASADLKTWVGGERFSVPDRTETVTRTFPIVGTTGFWRLRRL